MDDPKPGTTELAGITPPLTVRPRKRRFRYMRIAVAFDGWITDQDGYRTRDIPGYVYSIPPTIFVIADPAWFLGTLTDAYGAHPDFQYKVTCPTRDMDTGELSRTVVGSFGFYSPASPETPDRRTTLRKRLHQCWDVTAFSPTPFHKMIGEMTTLSLYRFACDVRAWAQENDLELRNSLSGYSNQLMRDKLFYPDPRRRVPRATNERARPSLPGNRVQLFTDKDTPQAYNVTAIDQRSAHHRIVQATALPNANTLYARGYYRRETHTTQYWKDRRSANYSRAIGQPGLLLVGLYSRPTTKGEFRLRKQDFNGFRQVYLWTNEVEFVESTGSRIDGIYAAWTSETVDTGLPVYGSWAQSQIESASPERRKWLKPLLHSTYGLLAAKPRPLTVGYRLAKGGTPDNVMLGNRQFVVKSHTLKSWTPSTANVIQRGLIESETQLRSLRMAQHLHDHGCYVLYINTDGMHVLGNLPPLSDDWSVKQIVSVQYVDEVSWIADGQACLPGRGEYERRKVYEQFNRDYAALKRARSNGAWDDMTVARSAGTR